MSASRSWPNSLRALRHRNFRLYFAGHAVSTLGTWVQQVALAWLVYRLTGSAALLGITSCVALLPQLFIGPLAGAWIDRHDKRRLLLASHAGQVGPLKRLEAYLAVNQFLRRLRYRRKRRYTVSSKSEPTSC